MMDIELLEKFLQGRCTVEEAREVKAALEKDPAVLEAYLREAAEEAGLRPGGEDGLVEVRGPVAGTPMKAGVLAGEGMPAEMEAALLASFRDGKVRGTGVKEKTPSIRRWIWPAAAAAAVVIVVVVTGWLSGMFGRSHEYVLLEATASVKQVRLADGSTLWLRPGSGVRVDQTMFGGKERLVELQKGEVFFDVVHNAKSPFIVETGKVRTADIGTSFDIKKEADQVLVTVATGEVKVSLEQRELGHVLPGNQVSVVSSTGQFSSRVLPVWMASVWKENTIQLKNASFTELAMAMQQLYGIQLQTTEEHIHQQTFTMQLSRQTPGEQVIRVICLFNQNQYRKKADASYLIY